MLPLTKSAFANLPRPPAAKAAPLSGAVPARAPDGVDRISRLPAGTLRNIVSRLPVKEAARTTVLSTRWRRIWHTTPLVLVDAHLLPSSGTIGTFSRASTSSFPVGAVPRERDLSGAPRGLADAVSSALAAHPGPFRCVYLIGTPMETHQDKLALWLQHLFAKGIQELFFINRIRTFDAAVILPATIFRCTSLTKLYIGFWRFPEPETATLARTAGFPYLRELGLCSVAMKERDLAFLLDRCPVLEKLLIVGSQWPVCLRLQSHSLRCVEVCEGIASEIAVVHASHLERLLMWESWGMSSKIKIGHAPKLRFVGFLVPGMHQLEIGNTVIKAETKACSNTTVPSVLMLAVQVKLGTRIEVRMLLSFLRCFPKVETLYVQSENDDIKFCGPQSTGTGKLNLKFWKEAGTTECVQWHIKKVVLRDFRGTRNEIDFLKFIAERAKVLEKMVIVFAHGYPPSNSVGTNLRTKMASANWANACCELMIFQTPFHQGTAWCYLAAFDLSNPDPFDTSKCVDGKCQSRHCAVPVSTCKAVLQSIGSVSF